MFGLLDDIGSAAEFQEARNVSDLLPADPPKPRIPVPMITGCPAFPKPQKITSYQKAKWTPEEDEMLRRAVEIHGVKNWTAVASLVLKRNPKQCRERWISQIDPALIKDDWTMQEDRQIIELQQRYGNLWTKISQFIPGRSSNAIKNRFNWLMRRNVQHSRIGFTGSMQNMRVFSPQSQPAKQPMPTPMFTRSCGSASTISSLSESEFGQMSAEDFDSTWDDLTGCGGSSSFDFDDAFAWP